MIVIMGSRKTMKKSIRGKQREGSANKDKQLFGAETVCSNKRPNREMERI